MHRLHILDTDVLYIDALKDLYWGVHLVRIFLHSLLVSFKGYNGGAKCPITHISYVLIGTNWIDLTRKTKIHRLLQKLLLYNVSMSPLSYYSHYIILNYNLSTLVLPSTHLWLHDNVPCGPCRNMLNICATSTNVVRVCNDGDANRAQ